MLVFTTVRAGTENWLQDWCLWGVTAELQSAGVPMGQLGGFHGQVSSDGHGRIFCECAALSTGSKPITGPLRTDRPFSKPLPALQSCSPGLGALDEPGEVSLSLPPTHLGKPDTHPNSHLPSWEESQAEKLLFGTELFLHLGEQRCGESQTIPLSPSPVHPTLYFILKHATGISLLETWSSTKAVPSMGDDLRRGSLRLPDHGWEGLEPGHSHCRVHSWCWWLCPYMSATQHPGEHDPSGASQMVLPPTGPRDAFLSLGESDIVDAEPSSGWHSVQDKDLDASN